MYSTPHRTSEIVTTLINVMSYFTAGTESMLLRIQSSWIWRNVDSKAQHSVETTGTTRPATQFSIPEDLNPQQQHRETLQSRGYAYERSTCSQPKFQNWCFSLEGKTFRIYNIWPINPTWFTDAI